jgi:transcriptional regulator with XRE-family HTH domain
MSQVFSDGSQLARAIRAIRLKHEMSGIDFAKLLGVTQSMVSRYEAGRALPGYVVLGRLLDLAEGTEMNPIMDRLADLLGRKRDLLTKATALAELEKTYHQVRPLWGSLPTNPPTADSGIWDQFREFTPNLAKLVKAMSQLCDRRREVDVSLIHILDLWLSHDDMDPAIRQCFADAAKYLDVALTARTGILEHPNRGGKKETSEVG